MLDNIISKFGDIEATKTRLNNNVGLRNLAVEFCTTFKNVRVGAINNSASAISLVMDNGLPAGLLSVNRDRDGDYYCYSSSIFVNKQKSTGRANKDTRDSKTITGLIKAVTKNKEWPQYPRLYKSYERGIRYAFSATVPRSDARVDVGSDVLNALLINYVEKNGVGLHGATIEAKYDELMRKRKERDEGTQVYKRFLKGCKIVGINSDGQGRSTYYVGNVSATLDPKGNDINEINIIHLRGYNYITECDEVAADMAIIKTYMQGKYPNENWNPFYIPFADRFYPEIDVSTGYENREMLWVLIPHEA